MENLSDEAFFSTLAFVICIMSIFVGALVIAILTKFYQAIERHRDQLFREKYQEESRVLLRKL